MAMSHEDMLKRARQLKKQKTTTPVHSSPTSALSRLQDEESRGCPVNNCSSPLPVKSSLLPAFAQPRVTHPTVPLYSPFLNIKRHLFPPLTYATQPSLHLLTHRTQALSTPTYPSQLPFPFSRYVKTSSPTQKAKNHNTWCESFGTSPSAPPPRIELHEETSEPDLEPLTRKFKSRGKKIIEATSQHSTSQIQLAPHQTVDDTEMSFWHPQFLHSQHGRKHNYLRHDINLLRTQDLKTLHESILANLHKAEASNFMLMDQFNLQSTQKSLDLEQKDQALALSQTETSRLTSEVAELANQVKKKDELLADLHNQLKTLEAEKKNWILKEKDLLNSSELLKDQIGSFLIKSEFSVLMQIYLQQTSLSPWSMDNWWMPMTEFPYFIFRLIFCITF
ncbi:hypothetical protein DEO72_LG9g1633 [Vigna unguiculata]|uniref:Uncharacterized protein n=1 Tax=Vigna unguiculata TaxID=3917 RepID=A0A4D6N296_VIGUN|nr:hypothetical protein DEO72_LG9g1633 [Vigna unguiculata]